MASLDLDTRIFLFAIETGQKQIYEWMIKDQPKLAGSEGAKKALQEARARRKKTEHKKKKQLYKEVDDAASAEEKEKIAKQNLCLALQKQDPEKACSILEVYPRMAKDVQVVEHDTGPLSSFLDHFRQIADEKEFSSLLQKKDFDEDDAATLEQLFQQNKNFIFMDMATMSVESAKASLIVKQKKEEAEKEIKEKLKMEEKAAAEEIKKAFRSNNQDLFVLLLNAFPLLASRQELFDDAPNKFRLLADEKRRAEKRKKAVQMITDGDSLAFFIAELKQTPELYFDDALVGFLAARQSEEAMKEFHKEMRHHAYKHALLRAMKDGDRGREVECVTEYEDLVEDPDVICQELADYEKDAIVRRERVQYYTEALLESLENEDKTGVRIALQRFPDIALVVGKAAGKNGAWLDEYFEKYGCSRLGPVGDGVDDIPASEKQIIGRCIELGYVQSLLFFQKRWNVVFQEGKTCEEIGKHIEKALRKKK